MVVVDIQIPNRCVKMALPNGCVVDILDVIFEKIKEWLQFNESLPESGGYIVGYTHLNTGNITLENISHPYLLDSRNRIRFNIRDPRHNLFLLREKFHKSYYMGVWHTHPQLVPVPSSIDWDDWSKTLIEDKTASNYVFFVIAGIQTIRVWVGDFKTKNIEEIFECPKANGLYLNSSR